MPPELRDNGSQQGIQLTSDRNRVMKALADARQESNRWPDWQLFWEQHPVSQWLDDRVLSRLSRHEAPVLRLDRGVASGDAVVVMQGLVSNTRSQPAIVEWFGIRMPRQRSDSSEHPGEIVPLEQLLEATGLGDGVANPGRELEPALEAELTRLLAPAVEIARAHLRTVRLERAEALSPALRESVRAVKQWRRARLFDLEQMQSASPSTARTRRLDEAKRDVERRYRERKSWVDGLRTVEEPYLRVAAVLISNSSANT